MVVRHCVGGQDSSGQLDAGGDHAAQGDRGQRRTARRHRSRGGAARRQLLVPGYRHAVHPVGVVGHQRRGQTVGTDDLVQVAQVGRRHDAWENVDLAVRGGVRVGIGLHDGRHCCVETISVGAGVGRGGSKSQPRHRLPGGRLEAFVRISKSRDHGGHIFTDRLGQAGRGQPDHRRVVDPGHVGDAGAQILLATEHSGRLAHAGRCDIHRLGEVADQIAADVRRAPLGTVQERDRSLKSGVGQAGSERHAHAAGVGRGCGATGLPGGRAVLVDESTRCIADDHVRAPCLCRVPRTGAGARTARPGCTPSRGPRGRSSPCR
ncbi:hypothetical protein SDC9_144101 [bioreactor metagenome]|uniref:Uncharacterized protein n=1 Tax=bioreactor metagenome TaxID=1076179 RepID=A0A645E5S9_9ZZZZ